MTREWRVSRRRQLVSHPDITLVLRKTNLLTLRQVRQALAGNAHESLRDEARDINGSPVFAVAVPIEHLGWTVFAEQPHTEALRPVYASACAIHRPDPCWGHGLDYGESAVRASHGTTYPPNPGTQARAREIGEGKLDQCIEVRTEDELEALGLPFNRMAERLQDIHATQETRIAERTHDLALANDAKTRFLAAASHDLRQPIHALGLFVRQLRADPGSPQAPALLEKIERSVEALEELLEALLDLSKLDVGAVIAQRKARQEQRVGL